MIDLRNKRPINIAVKLYGGTSWTGGLSYYNNMLNCIQKTCPNLFSIHLIPNIVKEGNDNIFKKLRRDLISLLLNYHYENQSYLDSIQNEVDVLFSQSNFNTKKNIIRLYWIPDFQYKHLPEMFSRREIFGRNRQLKVMAKNASYIILSSEDALKDFSNYFNEYKHKGRVLNFVVFISPLIYQKDLSIIIRKYDIPCKFYYLPNQFWKHKNHIVVLEALKILKNRGLNITLIMSGNPNDLRNPKYYPFIIDTLNKYDLNDHIKILGFIPHEDVQFLIRQSIRIVNPSLFEGWSTSVEEAKSIGKGAILSNIAVHREQNNPKSDYFDPNNPSELADILEKYWTCEEGGPDLELEKIAREELIIRMKDYCDNLLNIINS